MNSVTIHNQTYELYTWNSYGQHLFQLAQKIMKSGESFDRIIALAKGGTAIARPIGDYVGVKELSSIQIEFYTGIGKTAKTPVITQSLPVSIKNERILIVDDIADSGETLILAKSYLAHHGCSDIKTATLVTKPWSKLHPDYTFHTSKAWIIFPWESRETIQILAQIWKEKGDNHKTIKTQLGTIGFSPEEIGLFLEE